MEQHVEARGVHQRSVVGVFEHTADAERALDQLKEMGIGGDEVSVMMRDAGGDETEPDAGGSPVSSGAASGAAVGGLLGGLAGWMIAIGAIGIPGVGTVVGAGALAAMLTGMAIGAAAGGIVGALLGLGVPEEEAREYEGHLREGRILVTVHPSSSIDATHAQQVLQSNGGYDVRVYEAPLHGRVAASRHSEIATVQPTQWAEAEDAQTMDERREFQVGEPSAGSDALGSGAEGGTGTGEVTSQDDFVDELSRVYADEGQGSTGFARTGEDEKRTGESGEDGREPGREDR